MDVNTIPDMNPGIKRTVAWLNEHGLKTVDSGDGETKLYGCDLGMPYVHIVVADRRELVAETDRLDELLAARGIEAQPMDEALSVPCIQAAYCPATGTAAISLFNVTDKMLFGEETKQ